MLTEVIFITALVIAVICGLILFRRNHQLKLEIHTANQALAVEKHNHETVLVQYQTLHHHEQEMAETVQNLREEVVKLKTSAELNDNHHQQQLNLLQEAKEKLQLEFKQLAENIFTQKTEQFKLSSEEQLSHLLSPLKQQIGSFEQKIQDNYEKEAMALAELKALNQQMSLDAKNLSTALKGDNKTQGLWGEMLLEKVLELSGLEKGREYETQSSFADENNNRFYPDVIVHLPNERDIIVDAKVSLNSYERFVNSPVEEKEQHLRAHLQSVRQHIKSLGDKAYQKLAKISSLDFVLLFIPIEPAFNLILKHDESIYQDALKSNIIIVTPSTLLASLRTIENLWRIEAQNKNALQIADKAGDLYDKFVAFVDDMNDMGKRLQSTQKSYDAAMNKLTHGRGNLVTRAENMRKMGAKASKRLEQEIILQAKANKTDDESQSLEDLTDEQL